MQVAELARRLERESVRNGDLLQRLQSLEIAVVQAEQQLSASEDTAAPSAGSSSGYPDTDSCAMTDDGSSHNCTVYSCQPAGRGQQQDAAAAASSSAAASSGPRQVPGAVPALCTASSADAEAQRFLENLEFVHSMGLLCPHQVVLLMATAPQWPPSGSMAERGLQASCPCAWLPHVSPALHSKQHCKLTGPPSSGPA
jgi:hypothetical protein